jgi:hypothetical protein
MEEVDVFTYGWTNYDGRTDAEEAMLSTCKVTQVFFVVRQENARFPPYRLFQETAELVPADCFGTG